MKLQIEKRSKYTPEWNGNRELPPDQQVVVWYDNLPRAVRRRYVGKVQRRYVFDNVDKKVDSELDEEIDAKLGNNQVEFVIGEDDKAGFAAEAKPTLENLETDDGPVQEWKALLGLPDSCGVYDLITEIENAIWERQKGVDSKNSQ